jgi:hypothetical protein
LTQPCVTATLNTWIPRVATEYCDMAPCGACGRDNLRSERLKCANCPNDTTPLRTELLNALLQAIGISELRTYNTVTWNSFV